MGLTKVSKTDRSHYVWCYDHCDLIMPWWQNELAQNQHDCWGHPDTSWTRSFDDAW